MRFTAMILALTLAMATHTLSAQDGIPDGRVEFSSTSFGLLFGYSKGKGLLHFQGQQYPFTISGFKVATVGVTRVDALGRVYDLEEIDDFAGNYAVVTGGFTLAQGGGHAMLRNSKGVTLYLQNLQKGLDLTLGGGRFSIALGEPEPEAEPVAELSPEATEKSSTP